MTARLAESQQPPGRRRSALPRPGAPAVRARAPRRGDQRPDRDGRRPLRGPPRAARRRRARRRRRPAAGRPPACAGGGPSSDSGPRHAAAPAPATSRPRPREAPPRRAAEHRAARGAGQGAGRPPHRRPRRRAATRATSSRASTTTRACCARRTSRMAEDVHRGEFVTPAAEWLLDNFHLVASEIRDVRQNLPRGYYRELPKLATRELAGDARVYAMAVELIRHSDSRLDRQQLAPLHEQLPDGRAADDRRAVGLAEHAEARAHREPAPPGRGDARRARGAPGGRRATSRRSTPPGTGGRRRCRRRSTRPSSCSCCSACASTARASRRCAPPSTRTSPRSRRPRRTRSAASTSARRRRRSRSANVITSLRLCSTLDWSQYFESVSLVEGVLQRDPAGVYGRMDFLSRDRYRQAVEDLADGTGEAQLRVALRAVESARQAAESGAAGARGPRRLPPDRQGPRRSRDRRGVPSPPPPSRCGASSSPTPPPPTSGRSRS